MFYSQDNQDRYLEFFVFKGFKNGVNRIQPPLGLSYLTSYLREIDGIKIYVKDTAIDGYENEIQIDGKMVMIGQSNEEIEKYISKINPDVI